MKFFKLKESHYLTFIAITLFYFFEYAQMSYFNVLAPHFLEFNIYNHHQIASLSAAYYYGDVIGLIPVGYFLDSFPLRKVLLWAIAGSVLSAFFLVLTHNYLLEWIARFLCGFFGGTFSFVGGIRVLSALFKKRFSFFIGIFIAAGMAGGLLSQYPLLLLVNHYNADIAMYTMASFGLIVVIFNILFLHPTYQNSNDTSSPKLKNISTVAAYKEILKNSKNWCDVVMVALLDTPMSIVGSLWGIVILTSMYSISSQISASIVMWMFAGSMIGLPLSGAIADKFKFSPWIIIICSLASFLLIAIMLYINTPNVFLLYILFFGLGLFSSCQSLGFTWVTNDMKPELIGRNTAINSMLLMGSNGAYKQLGAVLLSSSPVFTFNNSSASNLLIFMAIAMLIVFLYASARNKIFT